VIENVRTKLLSGADDRNRQMVDILAAVLADGLPVVEAAQCRGSERSAWPARPLRTRLGHRHHQPGIRGMAERVRPIS